MTPQTPPLHPCRLFRPCKVFPIFCWACENCTLNFLSLADRRSTWYGLLQSSTNCKELGSLIRGWSSVRYLSPSCSPHVHQHVNELNKMGGWYKVLWSTGKVEKHSLRSSPFTILLHTLVVNSRNLDAVAFLSKNGAILPWPVVSTNHIDPGNCHSLF